MTEEQYKRAIAKCRYSDYCQNLASTFTFAALAALLADMSNAIRHSNVHPDITDMQYYDIYAKSKLLGPREFEEWLMNRPCPLLPRKPPLDMPAEQWFERCEEFTDFYTWEEMRDLILPAFNKR